MTGSSTATSVKNMPDDIETTSTPAATTAGLTPIPVTLKTGATQPTPTLTISSGFALTSTILVILPTYMAAIHV